LLLFQMNLTSTVHVHLSMSFTAGVFVFDLVPATRTRARTCLVPSVGKAFDRSGRWGRSRSCQSGLNIQTDVVVVELQGHSVGLDAVQVVPSGWRRRGQANAAERPSS